MNVEERDYVTAAWIARQAGVGRAAVANWRKRYPNFPQPVAGGVNSPLFSWIEVQQWLVETGKADQLAASGRTGTGTQLIGDAPSPPTDDDRSLPKLTPWELLARVMVSLLPRLGDGDPSLDDKEPPLVLDPVCRDATVLAAVAERFDDHVRLAGQALDEVDAAAVLQAFPRLGVDIRLGNALRVDRFTGSRGTARAVLCVPPHAARQWPAAEMAADPRWRFGLPDSGDPELAWVQHCVAHLRPRGVAVIAMSPVAGVRPSGRHVRAALVRAGVLRDVIALPAGLTRSGEGSADLWVLERGRAGRDVRMVDLSTVVDVADVPQEYAAWEGKEGLFEIENPSVVRVSQLELMDGETTLVPSRHVRAYGGGAPAALGPITERLAGLYTDLARALPRPLSATPAPRPTDVTLGELERSLAITILPRDATPRKNDVLFRTMGQVPIVADERADERGIAQVVGIDTDRLDPHFVAMFVRADAHAVPVANTHAALTREDVRRCRIPRLPIVEQRRYGEEFRRLLELNEVATRLAAVTDAVVTQTVHGLTTGALSPPPVTLRETIDPETDENEKRTQ